MTGSAARKMYAKLARFVFDHGMSSKEVLERSAARGSPETAH
jgi:hypothetical protein